MAKRDDTFGLYEAECQGCDRHLYVNDLGLCQTCAAKVDRDLIRMRDWARSMEAFAMPEEHRENLRRKVIAQYGAAFELLSGDPEGEA